MSVDREIALVDPPIYTESRDGRLFQADIEQYENHLDLCHLPSKDNSCMFPTDGIALPCNVCASKTTLRFSIV